MERSFRGTRKRSGMDFAKMRAPAETQRSGLRGKEEGQGNGAEFSRDAETERYGLCPDEGEGNCRSQGNGRAVI